MRMTFAVVFLLAAGSIGGLPHDQAWAQGLSPDAGQAALTMILDKAITAGGGKDKLNRLAKITCRAKGVVVLPVGTENERDISFIASLQGVDHCRLDSMTLYNRDNAAIVVFQPEYKDEEGWLDKPVDIKLGSTLVPGAGFGHALYAIRLAQWLVPLQDQEFERTALGELKVGERQTVGIKFGHKNGLYLDIYFDKEAGLPVKAQMQVPVKTDGVENVLLNEYFFDNYKEVGGIMHFTKLTFHRDGKKRLEVEVSDVAPQEQFDAKIFAKP